MSWGGFAAVFATFLLTHSIPVRPAIKSRITKRIGIRGFAICYSVLSIGMLALLIRAAGQAPYVELWPQMPWQRHVAHLGMLGACVILALGLGRPNPFSFGGNRNGDFDPAHPGIVRTFRHPVLAAMALWAGAHLLPNGDLSHVLLFGILGGFAIAGRALITRRKRSEIGDERWRELDSAVAGGPLISTPVSWRMLALSLFAASVAFLALLVLHASVIGVPAL